MDTLGTEAKRGKARLPHYEKRLKASFVKTAPPGRHTDGGGLYLDVSPSGSRNWLLRIVVQGVRRDYRLGSATLVSLSEARDLALAYRKTARAGGDPRREQVALEPASMTFAAAADLVHAEMIMTSSRNGKHRDQWINTLRTYAFPFMGDREVADIRPPEIVEALKPIWTHKEETARRVRQRMRAVFDWAIAHGHREAANPVDSTGRGLPPQKKKQKHFKAIEWGMAPRLMSDLKDVSGVGALALRFTMLTAVRSGSVRRATWSQFSRSFDTWTVPAENMKGGEEFVVPMPMAAMELLREIHSKRSNAVELVFPSPSNPKKMISENTMAKVLKGFYPDATVHGMRSVFRDWAEIFARVRPQVAEAALAHTNPNKVESAYLRTQYYQERDDLMDLWAEWLMGADGTSEEIMAHVRVERMREIDG